MIRCTVINDRYRIDILGIMKKIMSFFIGIFGFFRPVPRGPIFRHDVFEIVTKTTALACQNFMMALVAQGYDSCPMEGIDSARIKSLLNLPKTDQICMVISAGKRASNGVYGKRIRFNRDDFIKIV